MKTEKQKKFMATLYSEVLKRPATEEEIARVEAVLSDPAGYLARYVRNPKTAVLCSAPSKDDTPAAYKWRIAQGTPLAALVAYKAEDGLRIGWAKRNADIELVFDEKIMALIDHVKTMSEVQLMVALDDLVKNAKLTEKEVFFSKSIGKRLAILRAMTDKLSLGKRSIGSTLSGNVPRDIVPQFRRFIENMQKIYGAKAVNIN